MYISVTAFKVSKWWSLPLFQWRAALSFMQANKSLGIITKENWRQEKRVFCTLSTWKTKADMQRFRNSGAHLKAMQISAKLGHGITYGWEANQKPSIEKAYRLLLENKQLHGETSQRDKETKERGIDH